MTGASSPRGIGWATARRQAADGHTVYATMRDLATAADLTADNPAPAAQSGPPSHAYAANALRDPSRSAELAALLAGISTDQ